MQRSIVFCVLTLARQIGLLHRRLRPAGARMTNAGPEIGTTVPNFVAIDLRGRSVQIGVHREKPALIVFISTVCGNCAEIMPALKSLAEAERARLDVILVGLMGEEQVNQEFARRHKLGKIPFIVSRELGIRYHVSSPPYGVIIDAGGIVRAKGIVNHREHFDSLINALETGYESEEQMMASTESI